jgi:hypothetical protein
MCVRSFRTFVFLTILTISAAAQDRSGSQDIRSCSRFTAKFFRWYAPLTQMRLDGPAFRLAIEQKPAAFAPELLRALQIDAQAQAKAKGEIVGIDFDPFVGSQDPTDHYAIRNATERGNTCTVEVWRDSTHDNAANPQHPDAIAELGFSAGWQFTDFKYPGVNADLIQTLASLEKQREKP